MNSMKNRKVAVNFHNSKKYSNVVLFDEVIQAFTPLCPDIEACPDSINYRHYRFVKRTTVHTAVLHLNTLSLQQGV
jgi:hypothetical protein